jgi:hypothetical protein
MATGQAGQQNFCFVNPALFWRPRGAGLLNPAIPVQNPYVFGEFFQKFAEMSIVQVTVPKLISIFGETSRPKQNGWSQPPKNLFRILAKFCTKNKRWSQPRKAILHLAKFHTQKTRWSQPETDFVFWRNLEPKTKTRSQHKN